jgi:hypothetical protein
VSNHPITPLALSQINHDQVRIELIEPGRCPPWCASFGRQRRAWSIRSVFPDAAAAIAQLFARAHIVLAGLRAHGK